jgi:hypothetical protein
MLHERRRTEQELPAADGDAEGDDAWTNGSEPAEAVRPRGFG